MTTAELLAHLRSNLLRDTALPYLWLDTELLRYLNEAQSLFARRTHYLVTDTEGFTSFDTDQGEAVYTLDSKIIAIHELGIIETNDDDGTQTYVPMRSGMRRQGVRTFSEGRPLIYTAQVARQTIRFNPAPDATYVIQMLVAHTPIDAMALAPLAKQPEVAPEEYQLALADYAAWRALRSNRIEGASMVDAKPFKESWDMTIREVKRNMAALRLGENAQVRSNWTGKLR